MEFRRSFLWPAIASVFLASVSVFLYFLCYSSTNHEAYQKILDESTLNAKEFHGTTKQQRRQVVKDIWFTRDNMPLQLHLSSADSELVFEHEGAGSAIIEKMMDVVCYVQEELYFVLDDGSEVIKDASENWVMKDSPETVMQEGDPRLQPMQRIRYILADCATYHFQSGLLVAKEVRLSQYAIPGHTLVNSVEGKKATMSARAESLEISLLSRGLSFNAKKMNATF